MPLAALTHWPSELRYSIAAPEIVGLVSIPTVAVPERSDGVNITVPVGAVLKVTVVTAYSFNPS